MLSPHELSTLMLVKDAQERISVRPSGTWRTSRTAACRDRAPRIRPAGAKGYIGRRRCPAGVRQGALTAGQPCTACNPSRLYSWCVLPAAGGWVRAYPWRLTWINPGREWLSARSYLSSLQLPSSRTTAVNGAEPISCATSITMSGCSGPGLDVRPQHLRRSTGSHRQPGAGTQIRPSPGNPQPPDTSIVAHPHSAGPEPPPRERFQSFGQERTF